MINTGKLHKELTAAGITISGCNSAGKVWDEDGKEIQKRADVAKVVAAHMPDFAWEEIRTNRNTRLAACDWTQLRDAALTDDQKKAWALYRQALRDLPQVNDDPKDIVWPVQP